MAIRQSKPFITIKLLNPKIAIFPCFVLRTHTMCARAVTSLQSSGFVSEKNAFAQFHALSRRTIQCAVGFQQPIAAQRDFLGLNAQIQLSAPCKWRFSQGLVRYYFQNSICQNSKTPCLSILNKGNEKRAAAQPESCENRLRTNRKKRVGIAGWSPEFCTHETLKPKP